MRNTAQDVRKQGQEALSHAGATATEMADSASRQVTTFASEITKMTRDNPLGALAGATMFGVLIGLLLRGRSNSEWRESRGRRPWWHLPSARQLQSTNLNGADALRTLTLAAGNTMPIDQIVELHDDIKAGVDPATEFRCPSCGSLAFRYPRVLDDDKPALCAGCGAFVSTYGELRHRLGEQD
jgi:predicted RNA-binding Zn-ribbon protein involved in translation (DUF1610 family)